MPLASMAEATTGLFGKLKKKKDEGSDYETNKAKYGAGKAREMEKREGTIGEGKIERPSGKPNFFKKKKKNLFNKMKRAAPVENPTKKSKFGTHDGEGTHRKINMA